MSTFIFTETQTKEFSERRNQSLTEQLKGILKNHKVQHYAISVDDKYIEGDYLGVMFLNEHYFQGKCVGLNTCLNDEKCEMILIKDGPISEIMEDFRALLSGRRRKNPFVEVYQGKVIVYFNTLLSSDPYYLDGNLVPGNSVNQVRYLKQVPVMKKNTW